MTDTVPTNLSYHACRPPFKAVVPLPLKAVYPFQLYKALLTPKRQERTH